MRYSNEVTALPVTSGGTVTKYRFVQQWTGFGSVSVVPYGQVQQCGAGVKAVGVALDTVTGTHAVVYKTDGVDVQTVGVAEVEYSGTLTSGDLVTSDSSGRAVKATGNDAINGVCLSKPDTASSSTYPPRILVALIPASAPTFDGLGHLRVNPTTTGNPTISSTSGAATVSVVGNDVRGIITLTTGAANFNTSDYVDLSFSSAYSTAPLVFMQNRGTTILANNVQVKTVTATDFTFGPFVSAIPNGVTATFSYLVVA